MIEAWYDHVVKHCPSVMQTNCYGAVIYSYLLGSDLVTGFKIFLSYLR